VGAASTERDASGVRPRRTAVAVSAMSRRRMCHYLRGGVMPLIGMCGHTIPKELKELLPTFGAYGE
jgi:hypothetical protein